MGSMGPNPEEMIQQLFQQMQQQVQQQQAPAPQPDPGAPNIPLSALGLILGSVGGALARQPGLAQAPAEAIKGRLQERKDVKNSNNLMQREHETRKQSLMMQLNLKRLDVAIGLAKDKKDEQLQRDLEEFKALVKAKQAELDNAADLVKQDRKHAQDMDKERFSQGEQTKRTGMGEAGANARARMREAGEDRRAKDKAEGKDKPSMTLADMAANERLINTGLESKVGKDRWAPTLTNWGKQAHDVTESPDKEMAHVSNYVSGLSAKSDASIVAARKLAVLLVNRKGNTVDNEDQMKDVLAKLGVMDEDEVQQVITAAKVIWKNKPGKKGVK